jgi:hypothetical protein
VKNETLFYVLVDTQLFVPGVKKSEFFVPSNQIAVIISTSGNA